VVSWRPAWSATTFAAHRVKEWSVKRGEVRERAAARRAQSRRRDDERLEPLGRETPERSEKRLRRRLAALARAPVELYQADGQAHERAAGDEARRQRMVVAAEEREQRRLDRPAVVLAHRGARERQPRGHAVWRLDEDVGELAAHLRLRLVAEVAVDPAPCVRGEEHAGAARGAGERPRLAAGQRRGQRGERLALPERGVDAPPVHAREPLPRGVVDPDQPLVAAARAAALAREHDVVGERERARQVLLHRVIVPPRRATAV
jgi:hypothetical protein